MRKSTDLIGKSFVRQSRPPWLPGNGSSCHFALTVPTYISYAMLDRIYDSFGLAVCMSLLSKLKPALLVRRAAALLSERGATSARSMAAELLCTTYVDMAPRIWLNFQFGPGHRLLGY